MGANRLKAGRVARFVFFEGMLFGSRKKWWGNPGLRPFAHEGLDLCFFETPAGELRRLDETIGVPALYDGRVVHMTDDFLGRTVVFRHDFPDHPPCLSLYGHLHPDRDLKTGDHVRAGEIFARIAGFKDKKKLVVPHVHISIADPMRLPPANRLEWDFLNTVDRSVFIDPLSVIQSEYRVMPYDEPVNLADMFAPVSKTFEIINK